MAELGEAFITIRPRVDPRLAELFDRLAYLMGEAAVALRHYTNTLEGDPVEEEL